MEIYKDQNICDFNGQQIDFFSTQSNQIVLPFSRQDLTNYFSILLSDSESLITKNQNLANLVGLIRVFPNDFLNDLTEAFFQEIITLTSQPETCLNSLFLIGLITFYSDDFNQFLFNSPLFNFIIENIENYDHDHLDKCFNLFINLYNPTTYPFFEESHIIEKILQIPFQIVIHHPSFIKLIMRIFITPDIHFEYNKQITSIFEQILHSADEHVDQLSFTILKCFNRYLDGPDPPFVIQHFLLKPTIVQILVTTMNDRNGLICISIFNKMTKIDNSFFSLLAAFDFDSLIISLIQSEDNDVQLASVEFARSYASFVPNFAKQFIDFDFESLFALSNFELKNLLVELYHEVWNILAKMNQLGVMISEGFLIGILDLIQVSEKNTKLQLYILLFDFLKYPESFHFDFNLIEMIESSEFYEIAQNDQLSEDKGLAEIVTVFLDILQSISSEND